MGSEEKIMVCYLQPDLLIIDDTGMKQQPKRSGEYLIEIIMQRYETCSTMIVSNWLLNDGASHRRRAHCDGHINRIHHHAEVVTNTN